MWASPRSMKGLELPDHVDLDAARQTILDELPMRTRWTVGGEPLRCDFSQARSGFDPHPVWGTDPGVS